MFIYCLKTYSGGKYNKIGSYFWLNFLVIMPYVTMATTLPYQLSEFLKKGQQNWISVNFSVNSIANMQGQ